ncbi:MAG: preprotein translocase subunit SecY [Metamycoplasmataceae bacterium]
MNFFKKLFSPIILFFSKVNIFFKKYFIDFFKEKDLTKRIIFTLFLLAVFVAIGSITLPGIKIENPDSLNSNDFLGLLNTLGGGGLRSFSLVSLGISPFITASLIMTLAQTKIFPPIYRLSQSGPLGRMKINVITKALSFIIAIAQAIVLLRSLLQTGTTNQFGVSFEAGFDTIWYSYFVIPAIMVAGTFFSVFISEEITNKGVGNGTSLLILSGILISLPTHFQGAFNQIFGQLDPNTPVNTLIINSVYFITYLLIFLLIMFLVNLVYQAERRVPIQHIGAGRSRNLKELSYLPLKVNPAGVMPVIFGLMLSTGPLFIADLIDATGNKFEQVKWMKENLTVQQPIGLTIFAVATFIFTIIMSLQQSRLDKIVEDFSKNSTFIPGVRPGEQTEDYLTSIILRLSVFSAFYLTLLASSEYLLQMAGVPPALTFGGTSFIILVSVSIETIQQVIARYKTNKFRINKSKASVIEVYNFNDQTRDIEMVEGLNSINPSNEEYNEESDGSILW